MYVLRVLTLLGSYGLFAIADLPLKGRTNLAFQSCVRVTLASSDPTVNGSLDWRGLKDSQPNLTFTPRG